MNAQERIDQLQLLPHPEGGYYRETYRSTDAVNFEGFPDKRNVSTAIYFLLEGAQKSHFHRILSDELWFFHEGETLEIFYFSDTGLQTVCLGKNGAKGEQLQAVIPAGVWFGARLKSSSGYALVSCTVAPGFDFRDFELASSHSLIQEFPEHSSLIRELCLS